MRNATLLLLLLASAYFAAECEPGYEESVAIQVLDGNSRPIPNATVQITYQVDYSTGKGYATTAPKTTNSSGKAYFVFRNQETVESRVECSYTIISFYDNKKVEQKANVSEHGGVISVKMPAYALNIHAADQDGNALAGAEITVRGMTAVAGSDGKVRMIVGNGTSNVTLKYGQGTVTRAIALKNDTDYYYEVGVYDLGLYVLDDRNAPLKANVTIGGQVQETDGNGFMSVKKLLTARPDISTDYRGIRRTVDADLSIQSDYYVVYDLHAPVVTNLEAVEDEGRITLDMAVSDLGLRASGLAPDGIKLTYAFAGSEYVAPVFVKSKDEYEALIGGIDRSGVVELLIEAKDVEGNVRTVKGYFSVTYQNESQDGGGDGGGGGDTGGGFSLDVLQILGIGVGLIALLIVVNYIREKLSQP